MRRGAGWGRRPRGSGFPGLQRTGVERPAGSGRGRGAREPRGPPLGRRGLAAGPPGGAGRGPGRPASPRSLLPSAPGAGGGWAAAGGPRAGPRRCPRPGGRPGGGPARAALPPPRPRRACRRRSSVGPGRGVGPWPLSAPAVPAAVSLLSCVGRILSLRRKREREGGQLPAERGAARGARPRGPGPWLSPPPAPRTLHRREQIDCFLALLSPQGPQLGLQGGSRPGLGAVRAHPRPLLCSAGRPAVPRRLWGQGLTSRPWVPVPPQHRGRAEPLGNWDRGARPRSALGRRRTPSGLPAPCSWSFPFSLETGSFPGAASFPACSVGGTLSLRARRWLSSALGPSGGRPRVSGCFHASCCPRSGSSSGFCSASCFPVLFSLRRGLLDSIHSSPHIRLSSVLSAPSKGFRPGFNWPCWPLAAVLLHGCNLPRGGGTWNSACVCEVQRLTS